MKTLNRTLLVSALVMGGLVCTSTNSPSEEMTFTVDPTQSSLRILSASLDAPIVGEIPLQQQDSGSLETDYGGTIKADVTATSIQFVGGSSIVASNSGSWQPGVGGAGGSALANYGGQASASVPPFGSLSALVAMRGIVSDTTTSGPLTITGGTFPADTMVFGFDTNASSVLDFSYNTPFDSDSGTYVLTGLSTNGLGLTGTLSTNGSELVLSVDVNYTGVGTIISQDDLTYTLNGTLVARAPLGAPPPLEIHSLQVNPGQLIFTMATVPGENYMILGGTSPKNLNTRVITFTATNSPTVLTVNKPILQKEFFTIAVFAPKIHSLLVTPPDQLTFNMSTVAGENYTILGGTSPESLTNTVDTFPATNSTTVLTLSRSILQQEFFRVRQD